MSISDDRKFWEYLHSRYNGKVHRIERHHSPEFMGLRVLVEFRIPEGEGDELEMYRRINKVIEVIAEGNDE